MIERVLAVFLAVLLSLICVGLVVVTIGSAVSGEWIAFGIMVFMSTAVLYCTIIMWKLICMPVY